MGNSPPGVSMMISKVAQKANRKRKRSVTKLLGSDFFAGDVSAEQSRMWKYETSAVLTRQFCKRNRIH